MKGERQPVPEAALARLKVGAATSLPGGYNEMMQTLGSGTLGTKVRIQGPEAILRNAKAWRERIAQYWFWDSGPLLSAPAMKPASPSPAAPATTAELLEKYLAHIKRRAKDLAVLAALNCRAGGTGEDARGESLEGWLRAEMTIMARRTMLTDAGVEYAGAAKSDRSVSGSNGHPTGRMHGWVNLPSRDGTRAPAKSRNVAYVQLSVAFHNASRSRRACSPRPTCSA